MQHRDFWRVPIIVLGCIALSARAMAQSLPPDVRAGHWAATPVQIALRNQILSVEADKNFHGDAKVTHLQAVIALARLGKALETGAWHKSASIPVSVAKTAVAPKSGAWEKQSVSRYVFATVLTRMGDYANNGLIRAQPSEKDTGKSLVVPPAVAVTLSKSSPAYASMTYLTGHRMVGPGSPLLSADDKTLTAAEMTRAMKDLVSGLTDRVTDLGHDADGNTHDESFHPKKSIKKN
ncbi:MAG: S-layer y domain [Chthonomonadales bacterium]|nr:S-layer y domain [Chthonomonadales bacterium]